MARYAGKRKHGSQLKKTEEIGLWSRLKSVNDSEWGIAPHAIERIAQKRIRATRQDIISTIHNANIVEYKIDFNKKIRTYDERVVLRSKSVIHNKYNLHVVYSLTSKDVISVWLNHINDYHKTLDWSIYDKNIKVFV